MKHIFSEDYKNGKCSYTLRVWLLLLSLVALCAVVMSVHGDRGRCSNSSRVVQACVMKPIITGWETAIVRAFDKSLSVMSVVFCQRRAVFTVPSFLHKALHLFAAAQEHKGIPLLDGPCVVIICDLHFILEYDVALYFWIQRLIYIVSLSGVIMPHSAMHIWSVWHLCAWYGQLRWMCTSVALQCRGVILLWTLYILWDTSYYFPSLRFYE